MLWWIFFLSCLIYFSIFIFILGTPTNFIRASLVTIALGVAGPTYYNNHNHHRYLRSNSSKNFGSLGACRVAKSAAVITSFCSRSLDWRPFNSAACVFVALRAKRSSSTITNVRLIWEKYWQVVVSHEYRWNSIIHWRTTLRITDTLTHKHFKVNEIAMENYTYASVSQYDNQSGTEASNRQRFIWMENSTNNSSFSGEYSW